MCRQLSVFPKYSARKFPIKLKIVMHYQMSKTFRHIIFLISVPGSLTHLFPMHPFSTHLKHQKTLSGGRERVQWDQMD